MKVNKKNKAKKGNLGDLEKQVLEDFEDGKYKNTTTPQRIKDLQKAAVNTIEDSRKNGVPINIRLPANDLTQLRERAEQEGLPYQTLARSILHRYVTGQLADINHVKALAGTLFEKMEAKPLKRKVF